MTCRKGIVWGLVILVVIFVNQVHSITIPNAEIGRPHLESQTNNALDNLPIDQPLPQEPIRRTWMETAQTFMKGPAGQVVVNIAKEVISRSVGGTQVLSLNLTNLVILLFLKAIIFAAGLIGAGSWEQYARGRSLITNDSPLLLDYGDATLMLGFLAEEGSGQDGCLNRAACEYPKSGLEYAKAGLATLRGTDIFSMNINKTHYNLLLLGVQRAAKEGLDGAPCDLIYNCPL